MTARRAQIDHFLAAKRVAVIGASRNDKAYSRLVFREIVKQGYDAVPVNPQAQELDGKKCWGSIGEVSPAPQAAIIILPETQRITAVDQCRSAGVTNIWVYGKLGARSGQADAAGTNLITNLCPMMFLPNPSWIHRFHARVMKLMHTSPH